MIEKYPLYWPENRPRAARAQYSQFKTSMAKARDGLFDELRKLSARNIILSTNVELRRDGLPYANQKAPDDVGAAVYFKYKDLDMCFACDKFNKVGDNIQSMRKTIEAIRGLERWGASDMIEMAFKGFQALPAPDQARHWSEILGVGTNASQKDIKEAYREQAKAAHPDSPTGSHERFTELQNAFEEARG